LKNANKIRRSELIGAKMDAEHYVKENFFKLLQWYAQTVNERPDHVWYNGRSVESWAPDGIAEHISEIFGKCDSESSSQTLWKTVELFDDVARKMSITMDFEYNHEATDLVKSRIYNLLSKYL
jgi:hypothetical protein